MQLNWISPRAFLLTKSKFLTQFYPANSTCFSVHIRRLQILIYFLLFQKLWLILYSLVGNLPSKLNRILSSSSSFVSHISYIFPSQFNINCLNISLICQLTLLYSRRSVKFEITLKAKSYLQFLFYLKSSISFSHLYIFLLEFFKSLKIGKSKYNNSN